MAGSEAEDLWAFIPVMTSHYNFDKRSRKYVYRLLMLLLSPAPPNLQTFLY